MALDVKEMVKDNKKVRFVHYKDNELWYVTETNFEFPVPISDADGAMFKAEDKALFFMRWIRSHIKNIEESKKDQTVDHSSET